MAETRSRPQTYVSPRRHGDAWVRYGDGRETGLMPFSEAKELAAIYASEGTEVHRLPQPPSPLSRFFEWWSRG